MDSFDKYVGKVFDNRYKIVKVIGIGGMAVVFEAFDSAMKRNVAIKMLKDEMTHDAPSVKRFINESKAVSMLSHPNIVSIYDVSVKENLKYIVMERVEGVTLKSYIEQKGVLSVEETVSFSEQILRALEHAHSKGIVHRDIKPQNIMLLKNGRIKVTDFGIAKLPNAEMVTTTDKAIGTVYYISPEQASGKPIDQRSDLYSLGVMMYEMLTGKLPFVADSPVSVALMQVNKQAVNPRELNPKIPPGLEQIITHAMEKDPESRFQSAGMMLRHILQIKSNPSFVFSMPEKKAEKNTDDVSIDKDTDNDAGGNSIFPIIAGVFTAFITVLVVCAVVLLTRLSKASLDSPHTIVVDDFVNKQYSEVIDSIDKSIYNVTYTLVYDEGYEPGTIISQDPKGGEQRKVKENKQLCDIEFRVSRGEKVSVMPDISIMEYRKEKQQLIANGYDVQVQYENNDFVISGYIIRTEPAVGTVLQDGQTVTLYVSSGQNVDTVTVPEFTGHTSKEAMRMLISSELALGNVKYEYSDDAEEGIVIWQSFKAGSSVPAKYTEIDFTVSRGRDPNKPLETETETETETDEPQGPVEPYDPSDDIPEGYMRMPNIKGLSFFQLVSLLSEYDNLKVGKNITYEYSSEYSAGKVISQSIEAGSLIKKDAKYTVEVVIAR